MLLGMLMISGGWANRCPVCVLLSQSGELRQGLPRAFKEDLMPTGH